LTFDKTCYSPLKGKLPTDDTAIEMKSEYLFDCELKFTVQPLQDSFKKKRKIL